MPNTRTVRATGLMVVLAAAAAADAGVFRPLPDLAGGATESLAWGVSRDGTTVVGTSADGLGQAAVRWTLADGGVRALDADADGVRPYAAFAASGDGRVVTGLTGPGMRGFVWNASPGVDGQRTRRLGSLPGAAFAMTRAHDVDDGGRFVVGYSHGPDSTPASPRVQAVYWDTSVNPPAVRSLGAGSAALPVSSAIAVSGDGSMITGDARGPGRIVPFVAGRGGDGAPTMTDLPMSFLSTTDAVGAISRDGRVVVGGVGGQAFRFDGTLRLLASPVAGWSAYAGAMSDDGGVIVGSAQGPQIGDAAAVVWDSAGVARRLDQWLVQEHGVDLSGWSLVAATGVSGDGRVIVGYGLDAAGQTQGYAVVIPAPAGVVVLVGAGVAAIRRRR